jgi:glutaredoxin
MQIMLYSRRGCHLCEQAEEWLRFHAPAATIIDVDSEPEETRAYGLRVPVVVIDGVAVLEGRFAEHRLLDVIRPNSDRDGAGRR